MNGQRTTILVADIEKYLMELEDLRVKTPAELREKKNFYAVSMVLLAIFTRVIDLGQELVISKKLGVPATYSEVFALLRKSNVIDEKKFLKLKQIVRVRNRLSHEYFAFTEQDVLDGLNAIETVRDFVDIVLNDEKKSKK